MAGELDPRSTHLTRPDRPKPAPAPRPAARPPLSMEPLRPGRRICVAVSGGADSVALLRALLDVNSAAKLGLILSVAHVHHGIRGEAADAEAAFVELLANDHGLRFCRENVDTPAYAQAARMGIEEAARTLRYRWFAALLSSGAAEAVATAHTLNDQAETVLHKLLRGAWTEGLAGIHPVVRVDAAPGCEIVRPFLGASREQIVAWLTAIGQSWREDATNADLAYTRNRIRHELLPGLATYNPRIEHQLAHMATLARDEEAYWQKEVKRLLPGLLLPGRAVRGGGRANSTLPGERSLAFEVERVRSLDPALVRRLLREAAKELGVSLDFEETGRLSALIDGPTSARREQITGTLRAERTPRELRLVYSETATEARAGDAGKAVEIPVPGEQEAFGVRIRCTPAPGVGSPAEAATLRPALPGDRVLLRHSRGAPKRIKEVLERMGVPAADRAGWPVLVWRGELVWTRGVALEPTPVSEQIRIEAEDLA